MQQDYMADDAGEESYESPAQDTPTEEKSETKTALLPIAFFQGKKLKPGTTCSVRIESVHDDQCEVSYVPHESGEETPNYESDMMA
jgi:hypothetical protein